MKKERQVWPYWSVDLPGLSEESANRLLAWAAGEEIALGGIAVDPAETFSVHMDRETVSGLLASLEIALQSRELRAEQVEIAHGFADQLREWLSK